MRLNISEKYGTASLFFLLTSYWFVYNGTQAKGFQTMLELEYIKNCPEPEYNNIESPITNVKLVKVNRTTQSLSFALPIKRNWGEDVGLKFDLDIWRYGRWTPFPYVPAQGDLCKKFRKLFPELWNDIERKYRLTNCPIPPFFVIHSKFVFKGEYVFNYTDLSSTYAPFKGRFRFRATILSTSTNEPISCIFALFKVEDNVWTQ